MESSKAKRLVVILPAGLAGNLELAHRIYWLAARETCEVLYLTLVRDGDEQLALTARVATMKAGTIGENIRVENQFVETARWRAALAQIIQPGDTLVCQEEHRLPDGFLTNRAARPALACQFDNPMVTMSGYFSPRSARLGAIAKNGLFWLGCLAILALFTVLEVQVDGQLHGLARKSILLMLLIVELGSVVIWNRVTG